MAERVHTFAAGPLSCNCPIIADPGSVCVRAAVQSTIYAGDTLFRLGIGRTDLRGGSYPQIMQSIRERLLTLPGGTEVIPGHGPSTTIATELRNNLFLNS